MSADLNWPEVQLEDVADEITVGYVGPMADEYRTTGVPFFRSLNIKPFRIETEDLKFISPEFHHRIRKSRLKPGDVVIIRTGDPGTATVVPDAFIDANCSDLVIVRPSKELNPHFLAYYINAVAHHQISAQIVGAVQQHFNVGSAKQLTLTLPPRAEQNAIADVLRVFDRKLELTRRMNRTLEELTSALFRAWFVDFDPVVSKAAGRAPFALKTELAALFPADFHDSELGPIPKGWKTQPIGDAVKVVGGSTPSTNEPKYWGGDIAWLTPRDLAALSDPIVLSTERQITPAGLECIGSGLLPVGTVLLSSRAPIGYTAIAEIPLAVNQGFIAIVCDGPLPNHYVIEWLRENMDTIEAHANGTTFMEISKKNFRPIPALVPPPEVLAKFSAVVGPWWRQIVHNVRETRTLAALRDTLLPKLLSGEVRVRQAEKLVEATA